MLIAERLFFKNIVKYGKNPVSSDDNGTWYPKAFQFLKLQHHIHSSFKKSNFETTMQYIKGGKESFDNYFPCKKRVQVKAYKELVETICRLSKRK
jgi:putative transposase